jgi:hypothetical protein
MAERRYPVRIRSGVPPGGFGQRHTEITTWLDQNYGADGWAITPSGVRGVLNMRCRSYSGRGLIVANTVHAPIRLDPGSGAPTGDERARQRGIEKIDRHSAGLPGTRAGLKSARDSRHPRRGRGR